MINQIKNYVELYQQILSQLSGNGKQHVALTILKEIAKDRRQKGKREGQYCPKCQGITFQKLSGELENKSPPWYQCVHCGCQIKDDGTKIINII